MVILFIIWITISITTKKNNHHHHHHHDENNIVNSKKKDGLAIDELLAILNVRILLNKHGMKKQLRNQEKYLDGCPPTFNLI
ncbi:MAG: hypothetical protein M3162_04200 [Thermoproteota archaeon]|nr:hypothetical protein [Thermoproteota archaeon]